MVGEKGVEKIDQDGFVWFGAKDSFEPKVGEKADVFVLQGIDHDV